MKILFDTEVVLDLLLDRQPHSAFSAKLFSRVEGGRASGYLCASAVTTIHYLMARVVGSKRARVGVQKLLALFEIAPVNRGILAAALCPPLSPCILRVTCFMLALLDARETEDG
jgi:predicted nucleic acid-binding protein